MATIQKSLRIPKDIVDEIEEIARLSDKDFATVAKEMLEEAIKSTRCPGIVFTEGTRGRRARVAGSGIEVWEVIAAYMSVDRNFKRLAKALHWLTEQQLKSALGYYKLYPEEIDGLLAENDKWTSERIDATYPFLSAGKK